MRLGPVVAAIAENQLGLAAHRQLVAAGIPTSTINDATESGRIRRVERGISVVPGAPITADVRLLAKVLSAGDGAVLSHRSAGWVHGLIDDAPRVHEISVPRGRRPRTRGLHVHQARDLDRVIPGKVRGLPVTDVGRTILDCARFPDLDLELLIDAARREHRISRSLLPWVVAEHARQGRHGINRLRSHLVTDELPHSDFERLVCRWLLHHGITDWTLHHHLFVPDFGPVEPDLTWLDQRLVLELEGADHRDRRVVHDDDTGRQNALYLAGWDVMRLTYRRWLEHTERVLAEIRAALEQTRPPS